MCYQWMTPCPTYDNYVECPHKDNMGLALVDSSQYAKYAVNNVETVQSIRFVRIGCNL